MTDDATTTCPQCRLAFDPKDAALTNVAEIVAALRQLGDGWHPNTPWRCPRCRAVGGSRTCGCSDDADRVLCARMSAEDRAKALACERETMLIEAGLFASKHFAHVPRRLARGEITADEAAALMRDWREVFAPYASSGGEDGRMTVADLIAALQELPAEQQARLACFDADGIVLVIDRLEVFERHVELGGGLTVPQVLDGSLDP